MAFTTEFTQDDLTRLTKNIAMGVRELEHKGERTVFQSIEQMMELRDRIRSELAAASSTSAPIPCMTRRTFFVRD